MPDDLKVPEELVYCCMAHFLAKMYRIAPNEANKMTQGDFTRAVMFEQLEYKRRKFLMETLSNENQ